MIRINLIRERRATGGRKAAATPTGEGANPLVYVGMAVTSHNDGTLCTTVFDNVSIVEADYVRGPFGVFGNIVHYDTNLLLGSGGNTSHGYIRYKIAVKISPGSIRRKIFCLIAAPAVQFHAFGWHIPRLCLLAQFGVTHQQQKGWRFGQ